MRTKRTLIAAAALVVLVVAGGIWYLAARPERRSELLAQIGIGQGGRPEGILPASGIIEAEEVSVTTETGLSLIHI